MSFNQLQPPTPPPPLPTIKNNLLSSSKPLKVISFDECKWAVKYPDVQRACFFSKICPVLPPKQCKFTKIESILQNGPCCGIVALSMVFNGKVPVDKLLNEAQKKGFTKNGEMFSANFMFELFVKNLNEDDELNVSLYDGILNEDFIKNKIKIGSILLVPYDADVNHSPCLKNGHKAHWAIILGYLKDNYEVWIYFIKKKSNIFFLKFSFMYLLVMENQNIWMFGH